MARVLIIDDEEFIRLTLREALEADGHAVITAANGDDGLRKFAVEACDVVITDILMPEKEGIETIIELRKARPDVRIVVISGGARVNSLDFLEVAKKFGAAAALRKPFAMTELCRVVNECLAKAQVSGRA